MFNLMVFIIFLTVRFMFFFNRVQFWLWKKGEICGPIKPYAKCHSLDLPFNRIVTLSWYNIVDNIKRQIRPIHSILKDINKTCDRIINNLDKIEEHMKRRKKNVKRNRKT